MLNCSDKTVDQGNAFFVSLALHDRSNGLLDLCDIVQTFHLETLNDSAQDLVSLLLGLAILSEKLNILHQSDVVLSLQADLVENSDENIELEEGLRERNSLCLLLVDQLSEGHEE